MVRAGVRAWIPAAAAALLSALAPSSTQTAVANGDTRTITLHHAHTGETITATYRVNGSYDRATLDRLNWFLRDWRNDAMIKIDPRLFDVVWEAHRGSGSTAPIRINSAYRSPETNAMLRRRSRGVAEFSLHTQGKAMDIHVGDVSTDRLRETAIRMQRGGVGYYPSSGFVHLDVGNVRAWPRMRYDQLARLFPDGKSVHIATDGRTLPGYEDARVELATRSGVSAPALAQVQSRGLFATLFGWNEEPDDPPARPTGATRRAPAPQTEPATVAAYAPEERRSPATERAAARSRAEAFGSLDAPPPPSRPGAAPAVDQRLIAAFTEAPAPPRRPDAVVASLSPLAALDAPPPPQRPMVDRTPVASIPASGARPAEDVASLIGGAPGRVLATPGLPAVITEGAGPVGAVILAYAPADGPVSALRPPRPVPIQAQAAPRANRGRNVVELSPARLDRSNFLAMISPESIESTPPASALGSTIAPLRAAARREARELMFGLSAGALMVSELRPRE